MPCDWTCRRLVESSYSDLPGGRPRPRLEGKSGGSKPIEFGRYEHAILPCRNLSRRRAEDLDRASLYAFADSNPLADQ
jgi:hypothetical protein